MPGGNTGPRPPKINLTAPHIDVILVYLLTLTQNQGRQGRAASTTVRAGHATQRAGAARGATHRMTAAGDANDRGRSRGRANRRTSKSRKSTSGRATRSSSAASGTAPTTNRRRPTTPGNDARRTSLLILHVLANGKNRKRNIDSSPHKPCPKGQRRCPAGTSQCRKRCRQSLADESYLSDRTPNCMQWQGHERDGPQPKSPCQHGD